MMMVVLLMQMFRLTATHGAVHVAIGRHGKMNFFHGCPFADFGRFAVAIRQFDIIEQGFEPFQRSRGGRHLNGGNGRRNRINRDNATVGHYTVSTTTRCTIEL